MSARCSPVLRKEVVLVQLSRRSESDEPAPVGAPVLVSPSGANEYDTRIRQYDSDLTLLAQFKPGEFEAHFDAAWDGDQWTIYGRTLDR
jgi:hypothetical protein